MRKLWLAPLLLMGFAAHADDTSSFNYAQLQPLIKLNLSKDEVVDAVVSQDTFLHNIAPTSKMDYRNSADFGLYGFNARAVYSYGDGPVGIIRMLTLEGELHRNFDNGLKFYVSVKHHDSMTAGNPALLIGPEDRFSAGTYFTIAPKVTAKLGFANTRVVGVTSFSGLSATLAYRF